MQSNREEKRGFDHKLTAFAISVEEPISSEHGLRFPG